MDCRTGPAVLDVFCDAHTFRSVVAGNGAWQRGTDVAGVARLFAGHRDLRDLIESRPGLTERLVARCPELFRPSAAGGAA